VPVVRDVSISVGKGEIVAVIGPNGAGKSTMLKSLVGILKLSGGKILLGADDVTGHPPEDLAKRGVGYVPQVQDIFEPLSVRENLEMGGYLLKDSAIDGRIKEVCDVFPLLAPMMRRRADKLSGGERKMLAIGRVLMLDPRVLILDEPTANLAPILADAVLREQVRRLADAGKAVLLCCWSSSGLAQPYRSRTGQSFSFPAPPDWRAGPRISSNALISRPCF